ncbi:hypothetical protein AALB_3998 [Agarivorans albus MKT 106]|uniref:Glycosyl hydrolase n=1 Tax=Agarivorans albus MKT 106 TaxID=1331007 RepID=R9PRM1_AGAAL|nr:sialidase family protein [Agarivorans albus]GAD03918.1 hypothetical protein AALB_3998 [Agarivorans albus MKT 106]
MACGVFKSSSEFFISRDHGVSWHALPQHLNTAETNQYREYKIESDGNGNLLAMSSSGYPSISNDNGVTWLSLPRYLNTWGRTLSELIDSDSGRWLAVLDNGQYAAYSYDKGRTWQKGDAVVWNDNSTAGAYAFDGTRRLLVAKANKIYSSDSFGDSWQVTSIGSTNDYAREFIETDGIWMLNRNNDVLAQCDFAFGNTNAYTVKPEDDGKVLALQITEETAFGEQVTELALPRLSVESRPSCSAPVSINLPQNFEQLLINDWGINYNSELVEEALASYRYRSNFLSYKIMPSLQKGKESGLRTQNSQLYFETSRFMQLTIEGGSRQVELTRKAADRYSFNGSASELRELLVDGSLKFNGYTACEEPFEYELPLVVNSDPAPQISDVGVISLTKEKTTNILNVSVHDKGRNLLYLGLFIELSGEIRLLSEISALKDQEDCIEQVEDCDSLGTWTQFDLSESEDITLRLPINSNAALGSYDIRAIALDSTGNLTNRVIGELNVIGENPQ